MFSDYPLTLNSDAFNALKNDFNQMLRQTLSSMELKDAEEAAITIKLGISLSKDHVPDQTIVAYEAEREIIRPKFDHKVTATIQYKSEKTGTLAGDYELVWDKSISEWVMRPITNGQINLFDSLNEDAAGTHDAIAPVGMLGSRIAGVPPAAGVADAEYMGVHESGRADGYEYQPPAGVI